MKSITINNLVFTDELPTRPGWYLWTYGYLKPEVCTVRDNGQGSLLASEGEEWMPVAQCVGHWHRLVPAAWLEDAYKEGATDMHEDEPELTWPLSTAHQRMLGETGT